MAQTIQIKGYPNTKTIINLPKVRPSSSKKVVVFFIGGAADKGSYLGQPATNIINDEVKILFERLITSNKLTKLYNSEYLGFDDVRGDDDITKKVISNIPNKENTAIYIVGHSLGGWNGAHLSQILSDKGYEVNLLITLDPVGKGTNTQLISDVYWTTPNPKAKYWINITTNPDEYDADDYIADLGGQWNPKTLPQINDMCNCHHRSAGILFTKNLKDTDISASDMLLQNIKLYLKNEISNN